MGSEPAKEEPKYISGKGIFRLSVGTKFNGDHFFSAYFHDRVPLNYNKRLARTAGLTSANGYAGRQGRGFIAAGIFKLAGGKACGGR